MMVQKLYEIMIEGKINQNHETCDNKTGALMQYHLPVWPLF